MVRGADVSVVVATYNRPALVATLVGHLQRQTLVDFEVIIVDNGSERSSGDALRTATEGDHRFRLLRIEENRGPAQARNLGWRASSRPYIAFTDDDCRPETDWLERLLAAATSRRAIVQGTTLPPEGERAEGWFDRSVHVTSWSGRFETCNLLIGTDLLHDVHGFVEDFPVAMGEDTDLGFRAVSAGAETAFAPEAVVHHVWWRQDFRDFLAHRWRYAHVVDMFARNPATRHILFGGFLVRKVHLLVWVLVATTPATIVIGVPWLSPLIIAAWSCRQAHRRRDLPISAPRRFMYAIETFFGFTYEAAAFAVMSARHRTLVI